MLFLCIIFPGIQWLYKSQLPFPAVFLIWSSLSNHKYHNWQWRSNKAPKISTTRVLMWSSNLLQFNDRCSNRLYIKVVQRSLNSINCKSIHGSKLIFKQNFFLLNFFIQNENFLFNHFHIWCIICYGERNFCIVFLSYLMLVSVPRFSP